MQLEFKIEENAALKKIIKNIDDDSKQYKEKVTQNIEKTLTHRSYRDTRKTSHLSALEISDDIFDEFEKERPATTVVAEKDNPKLLEE